MGISLELVKCRDGEKLDDILICSKCCQLLEGPVSLVCGHYACIKCIEESEDKTKKGLCQKCYKQLKRDPANEIAAEVKNGLESVSIQCSLGCSKVLNGSRQFKYHISSECQWRLVQCPNKGCKEYVAVKDTNEHYQACPYGLTQCTVCNAIVSKRDMPGHQAVKRCFEKILKRERVQSARKLSEELRCHRDMMLKQRHLSDQNERHLIKDHYTQQKEDPNASSRSIQARIGSAMVVSDNYSRRKVSRSLSCGTCESHFLSGRRPSARRHSTAKVSNRSIEMTLKSPFLSLSLLPFFLQPVSYNNHSDNNK